MDTVKMSYMGAVAHTEHSSHPAIIKRLDRATGHLKSNVSMIEGARPSVAKSSALDHLPSDDPSARFRFSPAPRNQ